LNLDRSPYGSGQATIFKELEQSVALRIDESERDGLKDSGLKKLAGIGYLSFDHHDLI
jgi:hypothetical protein